MCASAWAMHYLDDDAGGQAGDRGPGSDDSHR